MRKSSFSATLAVAATMVFAACDLGGGPDTTDDLSLLNFDAAVVAGDGALEDLQMMHGPGLGLPGIVFPPLEGGRTDCSSIGQSFQCNPIQRDGLTYTRTITYFDADGNPLDEYDEATTASIRYQITVEGDLARDWWNASVRRERDLTVTGLLVDDGVVTWNGTGFGEVERSRHTDGGVDRTYSMVTNAEIQDVVIPHPRTVDGWPVSGSIVRSIAITRSSGTDVSETREVVTTITFNGTQLVPVTVGDETFTIDLADRHFGPRGMHGRRGARRLRP